MIQKGPGDDATILDELDADERRGSQRGRRGVVARNYVPISTLKVSLEGFFVLLTIDQRSLREP